MKKSFLAVSVMSVMSMAATAAEIVSYNVGAEVYNETYKEEVAGSDFMKEEAEPMVGIYGGVTVKLNESHYLDFGARYAQGESDYTGAIQGQPYGSLKASGITRKTWELTAMHKTPVTLFGQSDVMFGAGVGYRYLEDQLDQLAGGYRRENQLVYGALGLEKTFKTTSEWAVTPKVTGKFLLKGTQKSKASTFNLTHDQDEGYGVDLGVQFARKVGVNTFTIEPFYRMWDIAQSNTVYHDFGSGSVGTNEPKNTTNEYGVKFGVKF